MENTCLIYLGSWADPCALMDDYLHREMPNALKFLCFPLQKERFRVSEEMQSIFSISSTSWMQYFCLSSTSYNQLKFTEQLLYINCIPEFTTNHHIKTITQTPMVLSQYRRIPYEIETCFGMSYYIWGQCWPYRSPYRLN